MRTGLTFNSWGSYSVGASKHLEADELNKIPDSKKSDDPVALVVKCKKCGEYMDFCNDQYICKHCDSHKVSLMSVYKRLDKEVDKWYKDNEIDPDELD